MRLLSSIRRLAFSLFAIILLVVCSVACSTPTLTAAKPLYPFPTPTETAEAGQRAAAHPRVDVARIAGIAEWSLTLAPPRKVELELLRKAIIQANATTTQSDALQCAAQELANLLPRLGGSQPDEGLLRFIGGRCGVLGLTPGYRIWTEDVAPQASDEQAFEETSKQAQVKLVEALTEAKPEAAGFSFSREGKAIAFVMTYDRPLVRVEPIQRIVANGGWLRVRGRVLFDTESLEAYVTAGRMGVRACTFEPAVVAPEFEIACELSPQDQSAWVQLLAKPRHQVVPHEVLQVLALRNPEAERVYKPSSFAKPLPVTTDVEFRNQLVALVNDVRAAANLAPLVLSEEQSQAVNGVVAPLVSNYEQTSQALEQAIGQVTLGLMAGWHVRDHAISGARLSASMPRLSQLDAGEWLGHAFTRPYDRLVFLEPEAGVLALGATVQTNPAAIGAVAVTYRLSDVEQARKAAEERLQARLVAVRQARELGDTTIIQTTQHIEKTLQRIRDENLNPGDSLWSLVQSTSRFTNLPAHGFVWVTHDLDAIELPLQVLRPGILMLNVAVTHFRPEGAPWGQYAVFFIIVKVNRNWAKVNAS